MGKDAPIHLVRSDIFIGGGDVLPDFAPKVVNIIIGIQRIIGQFHRHAMPQLKLLYIGPPMYSGLVWLYACAASMAALRLLNSPTTWRESGRPTMTF